MHLTASNFAAAAGISPYQSRQKLWRILTGREQRDPPNEVMQWGIDNEHRAVAAVEAACGIFFSDTGEGQRHYTIDALGLSLGATPDGRDGRTGLEVKCPRAIYDDIPAHYIPQLIGQAMCADMDAVIFAAWTPQALRVWRYEHEQEAADWLLTAIEDFALCLADDVEPKRRRKPEIYPAKTKLIYEEL